LPPHIASQAAQPLNRRLVIVKNDRENLVRLQNSLEQERARILANRSAVAAGKGLSAQTIRELAEIDVAARAVAAELARHTPRLGYGSAP
jgi:hypothetical protein